MPILKGNMSYTRFLVKSESNLSGESIVEKLNLFKFRPLHPRGEDNETHGWCVFLSEYETDYDITIKDCIYDDNVVLTMRIDSMVLPKALLKSMVKKSLAQYQRDHNRFPDRTVKKEIELAEIQGLRARIIPRTKIIESVWCPKSNELRIFSRSKSVVDRYLELFQHTFMLQPQLRDFPKEGLIAAQNKNLASTLESLSHQPLFLAPIRVDVQ